MNPAHPISSTSSGAGGGSHVSETGKTTQAEPARARSVINR
jgi:hypothetical protein